MPKEIPLTQGKSALVDDHLFDHLNKWKWFAMERCGVFYASRNIWIGRKRTKAYLHHYVIGQPIKPLVTDHINGSGLDNRKENLRIVTQRENVWNRKNRREGETSSKHVGVCWHKQAKKWMAQITTRGSHTYLGLFDSELKASEAYQECLRGLNVFRD